MLVEICLHRDYEIRSAKIHNTYTIHTMVIIKMSDCKTNLTLKKENVIGMCHSHLGNKNIFIYEEDFFF